MKNSILSNIVILTFAILTIGCNNPNNNKTVKRYEIEFDGFKAEFYDKYDMWLIVEKETNVNNLKHLIDNTKQKIKCNDIRPVMWKINVHAVYDDGENERILTLASSTTKNEALNIGRNCYEADELIETLKILLNTTNIKDYQGQMRQEEYDKMNWKG